MREEVLTSVAPDVTKGGRANNINGPRSARPRLPGLPCASALRRARSSNASACIIHSSSLVPEALSFLQARIGLDQKPPVGL